MYGSNTNGLLLEVSLGRGADEVRLDDMSPYPGSEAQSPQDPKSAGGFASVFKGLAGAAKLTKSSSSPITVPHSSPSNNFPATDHLKSTLSLASGLSHQHAEMFEQLKDGSISERVDAAQALRLVIADYPLNPVLDIWDATKDLIDASHTKPTRVAAWELLTECVKHPSLTGLERRECYQTISTKAHTEDFHLQLAALADLSNQGRDVSGFDYDVFPLMSEWLQHTFDSVRAARGAAKKQAPRTKGKAIPTGEDHNFAQLFAFITSVIKFNSSVADDSAAGALINILLRICMHTSVEEDLRACIGVMDAIVTYGVLPADRLKDCVSVLCSIHCLVPSVQKEAWKTVSNLCRSHYGQTTVRLLLDVLNDLPADADKRKEGVREVRGVLSVLTKLLSKSSEKGYPAVPYAVLVKGLSKVVHATSVWKIHLDILRLANSLLRGSQDDVNGMLVDEDWMPILDIVVMSAAGVITLFTKLETSVQAREETENPESLLARELVKLISRLEEILGDEHSPMAQRQDCIIFFTKVHRVLPNSAVSLVLNFYRESRWCFPSDAQWKENLSLVEAFYVDRKRSTDVRSQALNTITEVYDMLELVTEEIDPDFVPGLVRRLLSNVTEETDTVLLREIVSFAVNVASSSNTTMFDQVVDMLWSIMDGHRRASHTSPPSSHAFGSSTTLDPLKPAKPQTPSDVVATGYVQIFLRVMNMDVTKARRIFTKLIAIAKSTSRDIDARVTAMQLLFRLRADWADRIYVTLHKEFTSLATSMHRTDASLARKLAEETSQPARFGRSEVGATSRPTRGISFTQGPTQGYPFRSSGGMKTNAGAYQMLWNVSDADILPEVPSQAASPVLCSAPSDPTSETTVPSEEGVLKMSLWLDAVLSLLQHGCHWEVYSFILVHLPSQLINHAIFRDAVPQLQELRRVVCDQIRLNSFQEPPAASALRRADVAICLFHTLKVLISYHQHFQRPEEDEIVRTFVHGIATWERSAKCCIHALTVCCHEIPLSTSKALVTILQRMAQIITQPYVAMHILEFLACLSRLPSLYVNFREEEYRIVFGISFRYLQYVRGKKQSQRPISTGDSASTAGASINSSDNQIHPNASDDLPQYVYTLAYHVIIFWFLALKLPDRANHVSWIAKNLFTDVDGSQASDEQAQIAMDFIQRVTYADVDESAADPLFTRDRFGDILKKRWLIGTSIVTVEQAVNTGWAQITKRQPSGTSSYTIRELFHSPPAHQRLAVENANQGYATAANNVLPSHLLVQLLSSLPQVNDMSRPIPLPEDDVVERAIRVFDRNSTVDGYKVGVVYVGENQTEESEILANISGSGDYVEFLNGLGTLTKLKGATFNTQGLDRQYDTDGQYTFCWRDRVTEIVFHVTTQMPTNMDQDPRCTLKKRHIGNDFVNIIFNDSGLPFKFDTFPSDFNFVNIVIAPESRASFVATRQRTPKDAKESFYKVLVMSKPGFPEISPASDTKIVSLRALPEFIRLLALNASVFSLVWANREGGEHISPWRNRLREINRLRDRYGSRTVSHGPSPSPPGTAHNHGPSISSIPSSQLDATRSNNTVRDSFTSLRRSSVATFFSNSTEQTSHRSSLLSTATTDNTEVMTANGSDALVESVDFSKWA